MCKFKTEQKIHQKIFRSHIFNIVTNSMATASTTTTTKIPSAIYASSFDVPANVISKISTETFDLSNSGWTKRRSPGATHPCVQIEQG